MAADYTVAFFYPCNIDKFIFISGDVTIGPLDLIPDYFRK